MKQIPLSKGKVAFVDDADYERLSQWKWCAVQIGNTFYATRSKTIRGNTRTIYMHREILGAVTGKVVDHKDGDGLNNTRENIRLATQGQNMFNSSKARHNTSGFKGVSRVAGSRRWRAQITIGNRSTHIGYYATPEEAARAYDAKASELRGEFAVLNFGEAL